VVFFCGEDEPFAFFLFADIVNIACKFMALEVTVYDCVNGVTISCFAGSDHARKFEYVWGDVTRRHHVCLNDLWFIRIVHDCLRSVLFHIWLHQHKFCFNWFVGIFQFRKPIGRQLNIFTEITPNSHILVPIWFVCTKEHYAILILGHISFNFVLLHNR